jgi:hypothetical protein
MNEGLTRILHRIAAVALLAAAIGAVALAVIVPMAEYAGGLRAGIARERELLGRFEAYAANAGAAETLARKSDAARQSGIFLDGETDALRVASLQALVRGVAERQGLRLASARTLPAEDRNGLQLIGMQAELDADLRQLQGILVALETSRPHLFVRSIQVAPAGGQRAKGNVLKVRLGIAGAVLTAEGAKP